MKKILLICSLIVGFAFVGLVIFKQPAQSIVLYGLVALCPLLHVFMMSDGKHKH